MKPVAAVRMRKPAIVPPAPPGIPLAPPRIPPAPPRIRLAPPIFSPAPPEIPLAPPLFPPAPPRIPLAPPIFSPAPPIFPPAPPIWRLETAKMAQNAAKMRKNTYLPPEMVKTRQLRPVVLQWRRLLALEVAGRNASLAGLFRRLTLRSATGTAQRAVTLKPDKLTLSEGKSVCPEQIIHLTSKFQHEQTTKPALTRQKHFQGERSR